MTVKSACDQLIDKKITV